ncbi:MAG TPA: hypothetical protein VGL40_07850 [Bacillota bacterium]
MRNRLLASMFIVIMLGLALGAVVGCRRAAEPSQANDNGDPTSRTGGPAAKNPFQHSVSLPDGTIVHSGRGSVAWKDMDLSLSTIGFEKSGDPIPKIVGNHAVVVTKDLVKLKDRPAVLVLVERTQPAAAGPAKPTYEYWLIVNGDDPQRSDMGLAYSIIGMVTGDQKKAREELLSIGPNWELPF